MKCSGLALLAAFALIGCGADDRLMPLRVGNEWSYDVKTGLPESVASVKITREVPVAGITGYELNGPMGLSRVAWKGEMLVATVLGNARFHPPLPLLNSIEEKQTTKWSGRMYSLGRTYEAQATLSQESTPLTREGRKYRAIKTVMLIRLPSRELEIQTWYAPGVGILNQVQRTREGGEGVGRFDIELDYLSGP